MVQTVSLLSDRYKLVPPVHLRDSVVTTIIERLSPKRTTHIALSQHYNNKKNHNNHNILSWLLLSYHLNLIRVWFWYQGHRLNNGFRIQQMTLDHMSSLTSQTVRSAATVILTPSLEWFNYIIWQVPRQSPPRQWLTRLTASHQVSKVATLVPALDQSPSSASLEPNWGHGSQWGEVDWPAPSS